MDHSLTVISHLACYFSEAVVEDVYELGIYYVRRVSACQHAQAVKSQAHH